MQKLMKRFHKNEKGFTLVELMVVVVIIGVLVAIAIPIYNNVTANAQEKACFANQRIIEGAAQQFVAGGGTLAVCADGAAIETLLAAYIFDEPVCPTGGVYDLSVLGVANCTLHDHY